MKAAERLGGLNRIPRAPLRYSGWCALDEAKLPQRAGDRQRRSHDHAGSGKVADDHHDANAERDQ